MIVRHILYLFEVFLTSLDIPNYLNFINIFLSYFKFSLRVVFFRIFAKTNNTKMYEKPL